MASFCFGLSPDITLQLGSRASDLRPFSDSTSRGHCNALWHLQDSMLLRLLIRALELNADSMPPSSSWTNLIRVPFPCPHWPTKPTPSRYNDLYTIYIKTARARIVPHPLQLLKFRVASPQPQSAISLGFTSYKILSYFFLGFRADQTRPECTKYFRRFRKKSNNNRRQLQMI